MQGKYYPPTHRVKAFNCPHCNVFSDQRWGMVGTTVYNSSYHRDEELSACVCHHCHKLSYWYKGVMILPDSSNAPLPHEDLPEAIVEDYLEARSIVTRSPRGAAALLRLCLQKLTKEVGEPGKDINTDIASLVRKGLPVEVQQALDILRVIGNESVHPGELNLKDDQDTAIKLFELVNFIVEELITRKNKISFMFAALPAGKREAISRRDTP